MMAGTLHAAYITCIVIDYHWHGGPGLLAIKGAHYIGQPVDWNGQAREAARLLGLYYEDGTVVR